MGRPPKRPEERHVKVTRARKARMGRPPKRPEERHVKVLLSLSPDMAARLDSAPGTTRQDKLRRLIDSVTRAG